MNSVIKYYNNYDEDSRLTVKHRLPEYLTTMKYIQRYLKPNSKILEIGAGTGRYSIAFAEMGYDVTAVELVPHNIEIMKKKVKPNHNIKIYEGNACDLSFIDSDTYDIVLLLGPMYHLFNNEDKHNAISEAIRVAKRNGIIFVAYCNNDYSVYRNINQHNLMEFVSKNIVDENFKIKPIPEFAFVKCRKENVDELMSKFNITRLHYIGTDMLSYFIGETIDDMSDEEFELYMKFHYTICERADCVGLTVHMLDIFRKD